MAFHNGPPLCHHEIWIGSPDLERIRTTSIEPDMEAAVTVYLNAALNQADIHYFGIYQRDTLVGQIFLHDINWQTAESLIGYHLFRSEYRHRGIGTAALGLLQEYVQSATVLTRLIIITGRENLASRRIAVKCGFYLLGSAHEDPDQLVVFGWDRPQPSAATK